MFLYLEEARLVLREISILRELDNHSNVVKLYDVLITEEKKYFKTIYLVFEYV
jgi:serine/threonine protein kinase